MTNTPKHIIDDAIRRFNAYDASFQTARIPPSRFEPSDFTEIAHISLNLIHDMTIIQSHDECDLTLFITHDAMILPNEPKTRIRHLMLECDTDYQIIPID